MNIVDLQQVAHQLSILAGWHQSEWAHLNPGETLALRIERMQSYLQPGFIPTTLVCVDKDQPLGSAAIVANDMDTHRELTPWLASVYVHPAYRCRGIASQLIAQLCTRAKQQGYQQLYLFTPDRAAFYARRGWRTLSHEQYHHENVTLMVRDL